MAWFFHLGEYCSLVFSTVWVFLTGVVLVAEELLEKFWPEYQKKLDRYIAPHWWRRLIWEGFVLLVYIAGFFAWGDEYTKVGEKQAEIERLEGKLESTLELRQRVIDLTERERELVRTLSAMREQLVPRRIHNHKRREFIRALREAGPTTLNLNTIAGDEEVTDFFADLHDLLIAGGWAIKDKASLRTTPWKGVHVVVKNRNAISPSAAFIVELLRENGIETVLVEQPDRVDLTDEIFAVRIGYEP